MTNKGEVLVSKDRRIISGIIDIIFYVLVFSIISIIFTGKTDNLPNSVAWIPITIYVLLFHCYLNWTPGMKIMHYKFVNSEDLKRPLFWKMILRWMISFFLRFSLLFGAIAFFTFKVDTGFYWDRWFKIKVINN